MNGTYTRSFPGLLTRNSRYLLIHCTQISHFKITELTLFSLRAASAPGPLVNSHYSLSCPNIKPGSHTPLSHPSHQNPLTQKASICNQLLRFCHLLMVQIYQVFFIRSDSNLISATIIWINATASKSVSLSLSLLPSTIVSTRNHLMHIV